MSLENYLTDIDSLIRNKDIQLILIIYVFAERCLPVRKMMEPDATLTGHSNVMHAVKATTKRTRCRDIREKYISGNITAASVTIGPVAKLKWSDIKGHML